MACRPSPPRIQRNTCPWPTDELWARVRMPWPMGRRVQLRLNRSACHRQRRAGVGVRA